MCLLPPPPPSHYTHAIYSWTTPMRSKWMTSNLNFATNNFQAIYTVSQSSQSLNIEAYFTTRQVLELKQLNKDKCFTWAAGSPTGGASTNPEPGSDPSAKILVMSSRKPRASMRSASSRTRYWTLARVICAKQLRTKHSAYRADC